MKGCGRTVCLSTWVASLFRYRMVRFVTIGFFRWRSTGADRMVFRLGVNLISTAMGYRTVFVWLGGSLFEDG